MEKTVLADTTNTIEDAAKKKKVAETKAETQKKNRIQVSGTKKPHFFYLNLAKRYIKQHNEVELSALGRAIPTAVLIAEILKTNGLAIQKKLLTSTVGPKDDAKGRWVQKAKIEIVLERTEKAEKESTAATEHKIEIVLERTEKAEKETPTTTESKVAAEEPKVPATEPKVAAEEPKVAAEEPKVPATEPKVTAAEEPKVTAAEEPKVAAEESKVAVAEEPKVAAEEPKVTAAEEPKVAAEESKVAVDRMNDKLVSKKAADKE